MLEVIGQNVKPIHNRDEILFGFTVMFHECSIIVPCCSQCTLGFEPLYCKLQPNAIPAFYGPYITMCICNHNVVCLMFAYVWENGLVLMFGP